MDGENSRVHRVSIGGSVAGQVVVGEHNVVINAHGSQVFVRDGPPPAVRRRSRPVGLPIPPPRGDMIGRLRELHGVATSLDRSVPVEISGPPGVGKTTLLRRFAADRARGGHPVVYLSAAGLAVEDLLQSLFEACYDAVDYRPDPTALRRLMGSIRALIVLDDFEGSAADLDSVLDAVPSGDLIVATTTRTLWGHGYSLELQGLPEPQAMALLARTLGRGLGRHTEAARQLCRAARGHPLALVRAAAWVGASGSGEFFADPGVLQRAMVAGLAGHVRDALRALCALAGATVTPTVLGVLIRRPDAAAALTALERIHLAEPFASGYRLTGNPTALTAEWQGPPPDPSDYLVQLRDWVVGTATSAEIREVDIVVVRVLRAGMVRGRHDPVRELARAVSPVLGRSLRWGCWKEVLALGLQAATHVGHAADLAYFTRETHVREQALGMAVGMTAGVGASATVVATKQAGSHTVREALRSTALGHPVATGSVVAALALAATVTGVRLTSGDAPPAVGQAPITTVLPTATTGLVPVTTTLAQTTGPAQVPPRTPAPPRADPGPGSTDCSPQTYLVTFEAVVGGEPVTRSDGFPWLSCDNEAAAALSGDPVFQATPNPCPPVGAGGCVYDFTFSPTEPGDYAAKLVIPSDSGGSAITFELRGVAVLPPTATTSPTGSSSSTTAPSSSTTTTVPPSPTVTLPPPSSTSELPIPSIPPT
ncbi:hypothetical protein APR11_003846 [Nocardia amikacinitolerans]|uniref:ATP-binding protein n=1 Tax=Nocardia amikacinitolerans TaxID=756689 RepID=UPI0020A4449E|nr:ATP-binding protein [Nocardia amikacinitolerans]MCP2297411.1 hypothetical protein [Nocardia amikacinitolerans]